MPEHYAPFPVFEKSLEREEDTRDDAGGAGLQNSEDDEDELPDGELSERQHERHSDYEALADYEDDDETHGNDDHEEPKDDEREARREHFDEEAHNAAPGDVTRDFISAPVKGSREVDMAERNKSSEVDQQTRETATMAEDDSERVDLSMGRVKLQKEDHAREEARSQEGQKPNPLALLTWDDLQAAFHTELEQKKAEEASTMQQFETLVAMYHEWADVAIAQDEEHAAKRLRTRIAFVQNHKQGLERKEERLNEVRAAFQKALSMLSGT